MAPIVHTKNILAVTIPTIAIILLTYVWFRKKKYPAKTKFNKKKSSSDTKMNDASKSQMSIVSLPEKCNNGRNYTEIITAIEKAARDLETASPILEISTDTEDEDLAVSDISSNYDELSSMKKCNGISSTGGSSLMKFENLKSENLIHRTLPEDQDRTIIETNLLLNISMKSDQDNNSSLSVDKSTICDTQKCSISLDAITEAFRKLDMHSSVTNDDNFITDNNSNDSVTAVDISSIAEKSVSTLELSDLGSDNIAISCQEDTTSEVRSDLTDESSKNLSNTSISNNGGGEEIQSCDNKESGVTSEIIHENIQNQEENIQNQTEESSLDSKSELTNEIAVQVTKRSKRKNLKRRSALNNKQNKILAENPNIKNSNNKVKIEKIIERDSANNSPSDVMFEAPCSQISDVYSEGSSDSGKGCSEGAATPTPDLSAAGSSVSGGDILIYQFEVPQEHVGKLIGKYGSFINHIKENSNTKLYIKKHPTYSLEKKVCAIEGTQADITHALEIIRKRFSEAQYPELTLEEFIFPPAITCPISSDLYEINLIEGVNNDVIVCSVITAGHLFVQQTSHPSYSSLPAMNLLMNSVYENPDAPQIVQAVQDTVVAAPAMGGWYRALVTAVSEDGEMCDVRFLDYGGYLTLNASSLRAIRVDFLSIPFQATECVLANVAPIDGIWTEDAKLLVQSLTYGCPIKLQVYDYTETGIPLVLLYAIREDQVIFVNNELVARGYAMLVTIVHMDPTTELLEEDQISQQHLYQN